MKNAWQIKPLQALCDDFKQDIVDGPFGSELQRKDYIDEGIPVLKIQNVKPFAIELKKMDYVSPAKFQELKRHSYRGGDIVMTKLGSPLGASAIVEDVDDGVIVADLVRIRAQRVNTKYLCYHLNSQKTSDFINSMQKGTTRPRVTLSVVRELPIAVPAPEEQMRIVGILDEAFEGIATAKANAERNLQNARALFESHLQSVFSERGKKWERVTLQTLLDRGWIQSHLDGNHGSDYPRKDEFISGGVPYISANCLDDEGVDMSRAKYLSPNRAALLRKGIAKNDDVLFAHNATVGPVAILHTSEEKVILGTSLTYYRCELNYILPEYLAHYMRSFAFKTQYLQVMRQSTRNQVPITKQREFYHVIPPLEEQRRIVSALDGFLKNGQHLASLYERKLSALDALKKSLLHKAFTGELTAQPEQLLEEGAA
jgi:type I restriction enzyme S subunit